MIDILHIFMQDEYKFAKSLISMITDEKCFEKQQHLFIIQSERAYKNIPENSNIVFDNRDLKYILREYGDKSRWIVLHALNYNPIKLVMLYKKKYAKKTIWRTWGHDVFVPVYRNREPIKNLAKKIIQDLYINKIRQFKCIGIGNACDEVRCKDVFGEMDTVILNYSYLIGRGMILKRNYEYHKKNPNGTVRIMVGHSGYPSDRQIEVLQQLSNYVNFDFTISLVLAYGHSDYIQDVKEVANKTFKGKLEIIDKVMPYEEYLKFLSTVDIAIMDQLHSAALGNISTLLYYGAKIYLNRDGVMAKAFIQEGVPFYYTDDIGKVEFDEFVSIPDNIQKERYSSLAMSDDDSLPVKRWDAFLNGLLE